MPQTARIMPDQAYLRECFDYDPETGALRWRTRPRKHFPTDQSWKRWNTMFAGKEAGCIHKRGRRVILINNRPHSAHRLVYRWMTGKTPETIDHINHSPSDNRWANLRVATNAENTRYVHGHRDRRYSNALKGAYRHRDEWFAMIGLNGKQYYIGTYATELEAHEEYCLMGRIFHGSFHKPT